jgi:hypothetical protein
MKGYNMNKINLEVFDINSLTSSCLQNLLKNQNNDVELFFLISRIIHYSLELQEEGSVATEKLFHNKVVEKAKIDITSGFHEPIINLEGTLYDEESIEELRKSVYPNEVVVTHNGISIVSKKGK